MTFLLSLFGIARMIREWATIALRWALTPLWHALLVVCVLLAGHDWLGRRELVKVKHVLASTEAGYRSAQAEAKAAQDKLNASHVATNLAINKGMTDDNAKGHIAARTAVADYARLHPVNRCPASAANPAAVPSDPGLASSASSETGMVAVSLEDLNSLAGNTVRAESCRAWGQALVDSGLAIVGD